LLFVPIATQGGWVVRALHILGDSCFCAFTLSPCAPRRDALIQFRRKLLSRHYSGKGVFRIPPFVPYEYRAHDESLTHALEVFTLSSSASLKENVTLSEFSISGCNALMFGVEGFLILMVFGLLGFAFRSLRFRSQDFGILPS
jgi:hypothetical protein